MALEGGKLADMLSATDMADESESEADSPKFVNLKKAESINSKAECMYPRKQSIIVAISRFPTPE